MLTPKFVGFIVGFARFELLLNNFHHFVTM